MKVFVSEKYFARLSSVLSYNVWSTVQPRLQDFVSEKILARYFSVSSVLYCVVQPIWHDYVFEKHFFCFFFFYNMCCPDKVARFFSERLSFFSLSVLSQPLWHNFVFEKHFARFFLFLLSYIVRCPAKHKRAPQTSFSHTPPDNVCNTDISN